MTKPVRFLRLQEHLSDTTPSKVSGCCLEQERVTFGDSRMIIHPEDYVPGFRCAVQIININYNMHPLRTQEVNNGLYCSRVVEANGVKLFRRGEVTKELKGLGV